MKPFCFLALLGTLGGCTPDAKIVVEEVNVTASVPRPVVSAPVTVELPGPCNTDGGSEHDGSTDAAKD